MPATVLRTLAIAALSAAACAAQGAGPVYKLLYSPSAGGSIGSLQDISEVEPNVFYALSTLISGTGATIFSVTGAGTFKSIHVFPSSNNTNVETLVQGTDGDLLGSAFSDSGGFYISISPEGTGLRPFPLPGHGTPNAWGQFNRTVLAPGAVYDLVSQGYPSTVYGLVHIADNGQTEVVGQFPSGVAAPDPAANILYGPDGSIYGVGNQKYGGAPPGFIYRFTPSGAFSKVLTFPSFPGSPLGYPLVAASDGNLFGTFPAGGANNTGYIYQATLAGQYQVLANFPAKGMIQPGGGWLLAATDGNIYGTTNSNHIFRYNVATTRLEEVYFLQTSQGRCYCQLIEGMDGKVYGLAATGGNIGNGAMFSLDIGLPKPLPQVSSLVPTSGNVGKKVMLWGNYLLGATSVSFDGTPATDISVTSVRSVYATVPAGATTGPVTVTTANGSFTTTTNFTVQ